MGFRTEDEDDSPWLLDAFDFAEGWCALENRSEVALGMAVLKQINQHLTLLSGRVARLLEKWGTFFPDFPPPSDFLTILAYYSGLSEKPTDWITQ